jgi:hypothetical protein
MEAVEKRNILPLPRFEPRPSDSVRENISPTSSGGLLDLDPVDGGDMFLSNVSTVS